MRRRDFLEMKKCDSLDCGAVINCEVEDSENLRRM
jgi:hypothetical protein